MIRRLPAVALLALLCACGDRGPAPSPAPTARNANATPASYAAGSAKAPAATPPASTAPATSTVPANAAAASAGSAPKLDVPLVGGGRFDLGAHRGRWVVVNFWATWCGPCLKEMPELSRLARRGDIDVIGLAFEDIEPAAMSAFLAAHPVAYPIAIIDTFHPPAGLDVPQGLPMTLLVAPDGQVAQQMLGPVTPAMIDAAIARHRGVAR